MDDPRQTPLPNEREFDNATRESRILDAGLALRNYAQAVRLENNSLATANLDNSSRVLCTIPHEPVSRERVVPPLVENGVPETEAEKIYQVYLREISASSPPNLPPRPEGWEWSDPETSSSVGSGHHQSWYSRIKSRSRRHATAEKILGQE